MPLIHQFLRFHPDSRQRAKSSRKRQPQGSIMEPLRRANQPHHGVCWRSARPTSSCTTTDYLTHFTHRYILDYNHDDLRASERLQNSIVRATLSVFVLLMAGGLLCRPSGWTDATRLDAVLIQWTSCFASLLLT